MNLIDDPDNFFKIGFLSKKIFFLLFQTFYIVYEKGGLEVFTERACIWFLLYQRNRRTNSGSCILNLGLMRIVFLLSFLNPTEPLITF